MKSWQRFYYLLTAAVPRHLPTTPGEYEYMKWVFQYAYDVPDSHACWATVASHLGSVPSHQITVPWIKIANAARRLEINKLIQDKKMESIAALQEQFKALQDAQAAEQVLEDKKELIEDVS